MQFLQDSFFYHSDSRLGADGGLRHERQLLVEEQKKSRARARKFSLETNRRRKALEERQKQWDKQEQRLRENVLHQRRQRVQDATERFQRAHLPPSQRRRPSARRNAPNIEDALHQIQGNLTSYTQQSSLLSSNSNISRSCTPSPKPPTVSRHSHHHQALSVVEALTKLLEEQSMTCLKISDQTGKTEEKQQDPSPQDSRLSDCCYSESLSSKDSLENEDPNHSPNTKNLQCSYSSILLDSEKSNPDLRSPNDLHPTSDLTPFAAMTLLGDDVIQSRKLQKHELSETPDNSMHTSEASWGFKPYDPTLKTESQAALNSCNLISLSEIMGSDKEHFRVNFPQNSPNDDTMITKKSAPDDTTPKSLCPKQGTLLDTRQQRVHDDRQSKHPSATEILLPAKNVGKVNMFEEPLRPHIYLNNIRTDNSAGEGTVLQKQKVNHNMSTKTEPSASINNLNKVSNLEPRTDKSINTALLQRACLSNIQSHTQKCLKTPEEEAQHVPVSEGAAPSVRFIKGILKKQSKYMSGDTSWVYGSGHSIFAQQVALAIRDSVELTRARSKDSEGNSTVKKKLRWFDEVNEGKEDKKTGIIKQTHNKIHNLPESKNTSEDHQLSLTTVSGASRLGPSMTPPAPNGYHFTKQAWTDVGVQVSLPQKRADEVKVPCSSTRTGVPKAPRRERSARSGAGPVSSKARKGTVIRPQSATEVSQIAKTQGKIMVPRPPPRMQSQEKEEKPPYITKTPYGTDHVISGKQASRVEQALYKDTSESFFLPCTHHVIKADSAVVYTPLQPSYACSASEVTTKGMTSSGHQETQGCSRRRGMVYNEKGLCFDRTPTDDEISQLWYGVRSALSTRDGKSVLRRQAFESDKGVRKPCAEQSRPPPVSGITKFPQPSQPIKQTTEPIRPFSSPYNVALSNGGLESLSQLNQIEAHPEGPLEERGIMAAMDTAQTLRPGAVQQRSQQQGFSNISLEEQKVLLSLDRLNHQLCCVREHVGSTVGTQGLVLIGTPSAREMKVTNHHKRRASSANNRSRYQKKS
ncbi:centrosomal protein of 126 kDa [Halichoeres trimaculatus]|uniref:centrosomal protein of 126 kDa n=1 Tax=Halichoeres trimaculatus TaxID=147232 RepID=UPI003D9DDA71